METPVRTARSTVDDGPTLTRADAQAWLRQFPFRGWFALGLQALSVLASNGLVLWLLQTGRLGGPGLIVLVASEALLLIVLSRLMALPVPLAHWQEPPKPWREIAAPLGFLLFWCAGAYGLTLLVIDGWAEFLAYLTRPAQWLDSGVLYALAVTTVFALVGGLRDLQRYRRIGPPYMSSMAVDVMARVLTLIFGGIPFAMPFFTVAIGGLKGIEWVVNHARAAPAGAGLAIAAMFGVGYLGFAVVAWLVAGGTGGWAIGFVLAKTIAELLMLAIPLAMREVAAGR